MHDKPERPDFLRELLSYDPVRYAALHGTQPPDESFRPSRPRRDLTVLAIVALVPAVIVGLVASRAGSNPSAGIVVSLGTWLLVFGLLATRWWVFRDR